MLKLEVNIIETEMYKMVGLGRSGVSLGKNRVGWGFEMYLECFYIS